VTMKVLVPAESARFVAFVVCQCGLTYFDELRGREKMVRTAGRRRELIAFNSLC
jgi:hypothetical protein